MTKFLISGYIGFDNFGDEAIAHVLISHLKNIGAEKITLLSANPSKTVRLYNVNAKYYLNFFRPILETDVLISGGGSLLQDITSLKSLIYYLTIIVIALILKKEVIIFAQGFTPFRTKFGQYLTKSVLNYCKKIYVRDFRSKELLENLGIKSDLISDPVFGIKIPEINTKKGIGIQLRDFSNLKEQFLEELADMLKKNFPNETIKLISLQDSLDLPIIKKFETILKKRNINSEILCNLDINEVINIIGKLEYLIGMRFHSLLVGALSKTKLLGLSYDIKVKTLAESVGFPFINIENITEIENINNIINVDPKKYQIPKFNFPEI